MCTHNLPLVTTKDFEFRACDFLHSTSDKISSKQAEVLVSLIHSTPIMIIKSGLAITLEYLNATRQLNSSCEKEIVLVEIIHFITLFTATEKPKTICYDTQYRNIIQTLASPDNSTSLTHLITNRLLKYFHILKQLSELIKIPENTNNERNGNVNNKTASDEKTLTAQPSCNSKFKNRLSKKEIPNPNLGLYFDRTFYYASSEDEKLTTSSRRIFFERLLKKNKKNKKNKRNNKSKKNEHLSSHHDACERATSALKGQIIEFSLSSSLIIGNGIPHPLENGMRFHHILGVPYIPGASIKGMLRGFMNKWGVDPQTIVDLLGADEAGTDNTAPFVIMDAIPTEPPQLGIGLDTPHYDQYNIDGDTRPCDQDVLPGEWHDPVPIEYLTVNEGDFIFYIYPTPGSPSSDNANDKLNTLIDILKDALRHYGIGAKTAKGFGRFTVKASS